MVDSGDIDSSFICRRVGSDALLKNSSMELIRS
jgi:hypothetical protein